MYEMMAGLKINFYKSEVMTINDEENWAALMLEFLTAKWGPFLLNILVYL